jgi:hypothetical protein
MWADRCTQRPHCALCALNTNDICTSSTTGLSSGYSIKPSPPSSFLPRTLQSYKSNANQDPCVRCQRIEFYWNQKCFKVHVYRCQAVSSAGLRHADTVHSASSDSCTGSSYYSYKMRFASALKILILLKRFFVTDLKAEEGMLSLDGSRTAYSVHQDR